MSELATNITEYASKIMEDIAYLNLRDKITHVIEYAEDVFGKNTENWLMNTNHNLGGVSPISLINTEKGIEQVDNLIGRIDHCIFA